MSQRARSVVVRYVNPTTNKALHIGHIRNAFLGSAAAACLARIGFRVVRHCMLEDVGPHMALAMHGLEKATRSRRPIVTEAAKADHRAHAYYLYGRRLRTPDNGRGAVANRRRPLASTVEAERALVPEHVLFEWGLGSPIMCTRAETIKSMAMRGQSDTLEAFGIGFDFCDCESIESAHVGNLVDIGVSQGVFRRLRDDSVVYGAKPAQVLLKFTAGALHESAHLLSFMHRCLRWNKPEWVHVAFAGREWAAIMGRYAEMLEAIGVKRATRRYFMTFHGMVTVGGEKMASRFGGGMLADEVFAALYALPGTQDLARASDGYLSAREIACVLIRVAILQVPREQDVEFSFDLLRANSPAWRVANALARASAAARAHWSSFVAGSGRGDDVDLRTAELARAAGRRLSFEQVTAALDRLCTDLTAQPRRGTVSRTRLREMAGYLDLLGIRAAEGAKRLDEAPSFLASDV